MKKELITLILRSFVFVVFTTAFICDQASATSDDDQSFAVVAEAKKPELPLFTLEPYTAQGIAPKLAFGLKLALWFDGNTKKMTAIYIDKVKAHSDAENQGLTPRTQIFRIDGISIKELAPSFKYGTRLNQIFINRKGGDTVTLEVGAEGSSLTRTVTLTKKPLFNMRIFRKPVVIELFEDVNTKYKPKR